MPVLAALEHELSGTEEAEASLETRVVLEVTAAVLVPREQSIGEADIDELDTEGGKDNIAALSDDETRLQFEAIGSSEAVEVAKNEGPLEDCLAMSPLDSFPSSPKT